MDFNRNQILMAGVVILLFGIQLRVVESFVLNTSTSEFIQKKLKTAESRPVASRSLAASIPAPASIGQKTVSPPKWVGWAVLSVGGVLILHSLAMPKPD